MTAAEYSAAMSGAIGGAETTAAGAGAAGGMFSGAGGGLMGAAAINAGTQLIGGAMQGKAAEKEAEEARKRMTYWGVDGAGNQTDLNIGGLLGKVNLSPMANIAPAGVKPWQPTTLDDLTKTVG